MIVTAQIMSKPGPQTENRHLAELDWLRGLAGILMVINHAGYHWFSNASIDAVGIGGLVFLGGLAPVLFFFATGVGYGLQVGPGKGKQSHQFGLMRKVGILFLADAMLWVSDTRWLGLNFLGFIALSMLVLESLGRSRRPWCGAVIGLGVVLGLRFGLGPLLPKDADSGVWLWLRYLTGASSVSGFWSICPWMAFPLAGFLAGHVASRLCRPIGSPRWKWAGLLGAAGLLGFLMTSLFAMQGRVLFRFGTMSVAYFAAACAFLAVVMAIALLIFGCGLLRASLGRLSLRGVQSLAFVPLHYMAINLLYPLADVRFGRVGFLVMVAAATILAFLGASVIRWVSGMVQQLDRTNLLWGAVLAAVLITTALRVSPRLGNQRVDELAGLLTQAALCVLLVAKLPSFRMAFSARPTAVGMGNNS